jgi:hypothetical protein
MLMTFDDSNSYPQPLTSISVSGQRHALPSDFVDGLSFLRRFVTKGPMISNGKGVIVRNWDFLESRVHVLDGTLYLLTNRLIVEYKIGENDLPNLSFDPEAIKSIEAFGAPPAHVIIGDEGFLFQWEDGQDLHIRAVFAGPICWSVDCCKVAVSAFEQHWCEFRRGIVPTPDEGRHIQKLTRGRGSDDLYLNADTLVERMSSDGKDWTSIGRFQFASGATRPMRFDRKAFAAMLKIATEINFQSSPICFRHEHGRGMLVERTLGSDVPEFAWEEC